MKFNHRLIRIAAKLGRLSLKLMLIRLFGIDGAGLILADLTAAHERLRLARPALIRKIGEALRCARSSMVAIARNLVHSISDKINIRWAGRQIHSGVASRRS